MAYAYAGSAYIDRANNATIGSAGSDVLITFAGGRYSGTPTPNFCSGSTGPYCNMTITDTTDLFNVGLNGGVYVGNVPTGGTAYLVIQLNNADYWTHQLTSDSWQNFNNAYKGAQYFNSGDTIAAYGRVTGVNGYGSVFAFGQNIDVHPVMFYLEWVKNS